MSKKRPTEASWESDEDLLGDGSSVSAFSSKMQFDDIDEDALLNIDEDDKSHNYSFEPQDEIVERVDLGISSENCAFDDTANSQELDYEDIPEEAEPVEEYPGNEGTEGPLLVDEQPNETMCTAQPIQPISFSQDYDDDDDDDDETNKKDRGRFQAERNTISLTSTHTKSSDIPDSLEITKEMQEEIDTFEKQKGRGKFHNNRQRGGLRTRGQRQQQQNQQRFNTPMNRGSPRQRGPNFGNRPPMFHNHRNASPNAMRQRGPHNMIRPQGPQHNQFQGRPFQQGFNPRPMGPNAGMSNGRPRFPHEVMQQRGPQPGGPSQMPQPLLSSQPQNQPLYQEQPQFIQPQNDQPQFQQPQHSQPQPIIPMSQPAGSTIHVNPNFQGPLPPDIHTQQHVPHSVPQPLFSQPQPVQTFPDSSQSWMQQAPHSAPAQVSFAPSSHPQHVPPHPQQHQMVPPAQRPGLLGSPPHGLVQHRPPHQGNMRMQPPQGMSQGQSRQSFDHQQFQPRPQEPNVRPITHRLGPQEPNVRSVSQRLGQQGPNIRPGSHSLGQQGLGQQGPNVRPVLQRLGQRPNASQVPHSAPQQIRQQRPLTNQNMRGPRPANQNRANLTQMRPRGVAPGNLGPRTPQMGQPRFQTPQVPIPSEPVQGWNPAPVNLVSSLQQGEMVDPEKAKKIKELEEKKKLRAERFKTNAPVKINEGSPSNKKIILPKAQKRPSGDAEQEPEDLSPAKTVKVEKGFEITVLGAMKTEVTEEMDHDTALQKALEDQKRHREAIKKAKEAKRIATANIRRRNLALKLAQEGKTLESVAKGNESSNVQQNITSQPQHVQGHQIQGHQQHVQGHQVQVQGQQFQGQQFQGGQFQGQHHTQSQQQNVQQKQFNNNIVNRGMSRGQMSIRGQNMNRGQGIRSQGQPISVLGQSPQTMSPGQVGRGRGNIRGQGQNRGRGRGMQKQTNIVQLQQVQIHENIDYESYDSQFSMESPMNRTVLPLSTGSRQVVGMNSRGAASQAIPERKVLEKKEITPPQRRIVVDSKQSSSVLIKDLPPKVDLGQISKRCSEYGKTKVFNYKAEEKSIVVQFSSPAEASAFLKKSFRFMVDMNYCTAVSIPDTIV